MRVSGIRLDFFAKPLNVDSDRRDVAVFRAPDIFVDFFGMGYLFEN